MSINDPILEVLSFAVDNELNIASSSGSSSQSLPLPVVRFSSASASGSGSTKLEGSAAGAEKSDGGHKGYGADVQSLSSSDLLGENGSVLCLFPSCSFEASGIQRDKKLQGEFLAHLLTEHQLVIENVEEVANWAKYLSHWRERLKVVQMTDLFVAFVTEEIRNVTYAKGANNSDSSNQVETEGAVSDGVSKNKYYMLSPILPEDSRLRKSLWEKRLNIVLDVNRKEREDISFIRRCLFCRDTVMGNRLHYFDHMRESHSFHIGQPDNLVFVNELLQLIEDKLNRLECLFCEHVFKDKAVLKEHMRKKQHRQLNPRNSEYDRFYLVNYLEAGKTWEAIQLEDTAEEKDENEWVEPVDEKERNVVCLFCKTSNSDYQVVLSHMKTDHNLDFVNATTTLDFYQKIKVVNFIRRSVYQTTCPCCEKKFPEQTLLLQHISSHSIEQFRDMLLQSNLWNQPEYFFPTYENDDFLTCLDADDNADTVKSEDGSNVIPEDLPFIHPNEEFSLSDLNESFSSQ